MRQLHGTGNRNPATRQPDAHLRRGPDSRLIWAFTLLLLPLLACLLFLASAALADPKAGAEQLQPRLVTLGDMKTGALLLESRQEGKYIEAPRLATDVSIDVTGPIARARITQRFTNPAAGWVEGIYVFPLPEDAAVDTLKMQIGDRFIEGRIKERQQAREIYEEAKRQGKKASLLEQERPNMFTNSVANIGPGETVVVQIEYQQTVAQSMGVFSLRFPLVVAPRYMPRPEALTVDFSNAGRPGSSWDTISDPVPDRDRISPPVRHPDEGEANPVSLQVKLAAGFPVADIESPHHDIIVKRTGEDAAILTLQQGEVAANKDFELTWTAKPGATPSAALFSQKSAGEEYMLLFVTPPRRSFSDEAGPARPREIIFVIDNSGSMGGPSIVQAKDSLLFALDRLKPTDRFNIVRFDDTLDMLFADAVTANGSNVAEAKAFVKALEAEGGTEMLPALQAALVDRRAGESGTLRQVVFLTDGAIGNELQLFQEIRDNRGRSRIFTVGIGPAPNSYFMTRAAEAGRGTFTHIGSVTQVQERMRELFTKLENPVLTDLRLSWTSRPGDVSPDPLPDLYLGEPIVLTARARSLTGELRIEGMLNEKPWAVTIPLDQAETGSGIAKLWARRKIAAIEAFRYSGPDPEQADRQILSLALEHHLVSRVTSLVAVDVTPSRPGEKTLTSRDVPLNLPEGWDFEKVFGGEVQMQRKAMAPQPQYDRIAQLIASRSGAPAALAHTPRTQLVLPVGSTLADRHILLGLLLVIFAGMCLLTGTLWRQAGRGFAGLR